VSVVLAFDTATPATVVGVATPYGMLEAREDPPPGSRGEHASRLLTLADRLLAEAEAGWEDVERLGVGVGPGGFTGLRIGVATGRALALANPAMALVPLSSLEALVEGVAPWQQGRAPRRSMSGQGGARDAQPETLVAVLDARRGEAFAAAWEGPRRVLAPGAYGPEQLAERLQALDGRLRAVGDGAVRFRAELKAAGAAIDPDDSAVHRIAGAALCRLAQVAEPAGRDALLPDYRRDADAKPLSAR
jgi:tRNA threonylcarbamoyladenosine biosynthesis protein TsaB